MWAQFTQWVSNISVSRSFCYLRLPVNICWFSLVILTRGYHFYRFTFWTRLFTIGNMAKAKRSEFVQIIQNENESFFCTCSGADTASNTFKTTGLLIGFHRYFTIDGMICTRLMKFICIWISRKGWNLSFPIRSFLFAFLTVFYIVAL